MYFPRIEQHVRPSTLKGYRDIWEGHLKPRCAQVWLKEVRTYHVQGWLDEIAFPGSLSRRNCSILSAPLARFSSSPSAGIFCGREPIRDTAVAPSAKEPQQTYAYSLDEIQAILSKLPEPAATIFAVAAFTGLRRGEIAGMRWQDYRDGEIHVNQSVWEGQPPAKNVSESGGGPGN